MSGFSLTSPFIIVCARLIIDTPHTLRIVPSVYTFYIYIYIHHELHIHYTYIVYSYCALLIIDTWHTLGILPNLESGYNALFL